MITRITKANADKYRVLFADAVEALRTHDANGFSENKAEFTEPVIKTTATYTEVNISEEDFLPGIHYIKVGSGEQDYEQTALDAVFIPNKTYALLTESSDAITSLEDYFGYIEQLRAIDRRYTILPLEDEENFFEIDANTRAINIPKSFKDNGVAVQGDEIAEILYFKINRFFDMDDLGEKNVYIQWKAPANPNDKTATRKEGVSVPWVIDRNIKPGYVIIGWPLASEITEFPGKLDFSVRFYTMGEEDGKIKYSLSTTTSTVEIKEGLNYDLEKLETDQSAVIDSANLIINRLTNTDKDDPNAPIPENPEFIDQIILNAQDYDVSYDEKGNPVYEVYLTNPSTGEESDAIYSVQAVVNDAGTITYTWFKKDEFGEIVSSGAKSRIAFKEVDAGEVYNPNKTYYKEEAIDTYVRFDFEKEGYANLSEALAAGVKLYERFSEVTIESTGNNVLGSYQVRATNRVSRKTSKTFGGIAYVHGPEEPQIITDLPGQEVFVSNGDGTLDSITLELETDTDAHAYNHYTYMYRSFQSPESGEEDVVLNAPNTNSYTIAGEIYDENYENKTYGDGYYWVILDSKLNGKTETVTSEKVRVTHEASPVTITNDTTNSSNGDYSINTPLKVSVTFNPIEERNRISEVDYVTYQWYKYGGTQSFDTLKADLDAAERGSYVVKPTDVPIAQANKDTVKLTNTDRDENGYYFCQVTNYYNGTEAVRCSAFFNVVDTPN